MNTIFAWGGVSVVILVVAFSSWALCQAASDADDEQERREIERTKREQRWHAYCAQRAERKRQAS